MSVEDIIFYAVVLAAIAVICFFGAVVVTGTPKRKTVLVHAPTRVPRVVQPRGTEPK